RAAAACFNAADPAVCPTGQLAAVLDGVVISAPSVNDTFATTNEAVITGNFSQDDAEDLAQKLRYGALPVTFERQQSQDVSATIGRDALRAGVAAGLIGLAVVAVYILLYYRILGLVALTSLGLSFGLLWVIIAVLGEKQGLALSLSGVVGIIVSIGVSIDSNIVYFEQIKDDMVGGRTLRSSSQRAFRGAMSTIIKADLVSLIGAGLLYFLTVGPVKGFALFLGLSALLDLLASYCFMRPAVLWMSRWSLATRSPKAFGIPSLTPTPVLAGAAAGEARS
ncbi:MAG: SecD/SecF family protein translocase subunit, partial [Acidimicrobiales bacterium]